MALAFLKIPGNEVNALERNLNSIILEGRLKSKCFEPFTRFL